MWIFAAGALLVGAGCSSGGATATCATDLGARACLTPKGSADNYTVQATGFQPNSDVQMTVEGRPAGAAPSGMKIRVGADGTSLTGAGMVGMFGGPGPTTMTIIFSGRSSSGTDVSLPVVVKR